MKTEVKICKNCKKDFTIEPEDFNFYEKIKVPPPTFCPECRQQRRYAWRNERTFYRRECDLCGKSIVTMYSPNKSFKVYCIKCWWGDGWDPSSYGRDFDFSRPFFEQFQELQTLVPRIAVYNKTNINSDYTNHSGDCRNTYLSSCCFYDEDVLYSNWIMKSRSCVDNSYIYEGGEKLYECIDSRKSYHCQFGFLIENCVDCFYCYDLHNCTDCFLSSNLRNKKYVLKNIQYSREDYLEKVKEYNLSSSKIRKDVYKEFLGLLENVSIHRYVISERNKNCSGNMLFNSKNVKDSFDSDHIEDSKYVFSAIDVKSSVDMYHIGWGTELAYEIHGSKGYYNCQFCHHSGNNRNMMYSDSCQDCADVFGCISVKNGEHMIFNKKYGKEEYALLREKIIEHMKKTREYGEFFPISISPFGYNETQGNYYMPIKKDDALARGWKWENQAPGIFGKETLKADQIPDSIEEISDQITKEVLACEDCKRNYNIVPDELTFYRNEIVPIPRKCPECRHKKRFAIRLPRRLWHRSCMCEKGNHGHDGKCKIEFETAYSPERKEKVYCESCYNKEVY